MLAVAIVDDQTVARAGMEKLIGEMPTLKVVCSVASVDELDTDPARDVMVLGLTPRTANRALLAVRRLARSSHVLVTSSNDNVAALFEGLRAGARGCVTQQSDEEVIRLAVATVAFGGVFVCPSLVPRYQAELLRRTADDPMALSPREVEALRWIAKGFTHAQVARRMGVTETTIDTYAKRIRAKLNVGNKAQLTRMAIELGHLSDEHPGSSAA
jgi:DNA-binding NarL/FixJ family response regulator